jgi:hypothetical protein
MLGIIFRLLLKIFRLFQIIFQMLQNNFRLFQKIFRLSVRAGEMAGHSAVRSLAYLLL